MMMGNIMGGLKVSLAAAAAFAEPAEAQRRQAITSIYTNLELDRCRQLPVPDDAPASAEWRCTGYRGIPLFVALGDERFDIDAGARNTDFETASAFSSAPERVEWRLRGGKAFAIIYRLRLSPSEGPPHSVLGVETIGEERRPGCLIAWIDGRTPDANAVARQQADRHAAAFRCGRDRARQIGEAG
jgi:hypothetical protein